MIDEADDLPACYMFRIYELAMQVEDQVDYLSGVHPLLNVLCYCHLVYADLVRYAIEFVLKSKLWWPVLDTKVDRLYDGTGR